MEDNSNLTAFEELGQTRRSTSTGKEWQGSKPSNEIKTLVGQLGLRYRPSAQADLEAHAAKLALLCNDIATLPPNMLRLAISKWVSESPFMPTAADLTRLCRQIAEDDPRKAARDSYDNLQILANRHNANMSEEHFEQMRWVVRGHDLTLEPTAPVKPKLDIQTGPLTRQELDNLAPDVESLGLKYGFLTYRDGQLIETA